MKKLSWIALAAATLAAGVAIAQGPPGGPPPGPGRPGGPGGPGHPDGFMNFLKNFPLFKALDANGDGVIDAKEIANAPAALKTLDKNKDGKLTQDELMPNFGRPGGGPGGPGRPGGPGGPPGGPGGPPGGPGGPPGGPGGPPGGPGGPPGRPGGPPGPPGGFLRMMPLFKALDANGDGVIDAKEIANAPAALKTLDKNKDGKLTSDELRPNFGPGRPGGPGGPPGGPGAGKPGGAPPKP